MKYIIGRREFCKIASGGLLGYVLLGGCKKSTKNIINNPPKTPEPEPEPEPEPRPENIAPLLLINREFPNNGRVKYIVEGTDSDGFVKTIMTKYNQEEFISFEGNRFESAKEISCRENFFEAIAFDEKGLSTRLLDSFNVANRTEARDHVEALLINANAVYAREDRFNLNGEVHDIDFVAFPDGNENLMPSVIRYVDIGDDIDKEMRNQKRFNSITLDANGTVNNLYVYRMPLEEITPLVSRFIASNYRRKLE